jgi:hypothetical protein
MTTDASRWGTAVAAEPVVTTTGARGQVMTVTRLGQAGMGKVCSTTKTVVVALAVREGGHATSLDSL